METLEERVLKHYHAFVNNEYISIADALRSIATEQDRIARQEERERCIEAAQGWLCKLCYDACYCDQNANECCQCEAIRKAMKGGEV